MINELENREHYCDDCLADAKWSNPLQFEADCGLHLRRELRDGKCDHCGIVIEHGEAVHYAR